MKKSKYTLNKIVERMCQMKFLYKYCDYIKYNKEAYTQYFEDIKYHYVNYRVSDLAENKCIIPTSQWQLSYNIYMVIIIIFYLEKININLYIKKIEMYILY